MSVVCYKTVFAIKTDYGSKACVLNRCYCVCAWCNYV